MRKTQKLMNDRKRSPGSLFAIFMICASLCTLVHRPLPHGFMSTALDRFAMHIIEPVLRVTYYWPAHNLCPNAHCRLYWTRSVLTILSQVIDPRNLIDIDPYLSLSTQNFDGVEVRMYVPGDRIGDGAIFFVHGGGFVMGNTLIYEGLMRRMAKQSRSLIISVEYSLAPEAKFPQGLIDVERALLHIAQNGEQYGINASKIIVMGDSAGGNLVAATAQRMRRRTDVVIAGQVLLYPVLQFHDLQMQSFRHFYRDLDGFALVDPLSLANYYMWYAGVDVDNRPDLVYAALKNAHVSSNVRNKTSHLFINHDVPAYLSHSNLPDVEEHSNFETHELLEQRLLDPSFVPFIQEDLTDLPPTFMMSCEFDILRDEGIMYAARLKRAGVPVVWKHYEHGFHAMLNFHNELFLAQEALTDILDWTNIILNGPVN